jgi:hypothetical protein
LKTELYAFAKEVYEMSLLLRELIRTIVNTTLQPSYSCFVFWGVLGSNICEMKGYFDIAFLVFLSTFRKILL